MAGPDDGPLLLPICYHQPAPSPTTEQSSSTYPNQSSHSTVKRPTGKRPGGQAITKQTSISFRSERRSPPDQPHRFYLSGGGPSSRPQLPPSNDHHLQRLQARDNDFATKVDHDGRTRVKRNYEKQYHQWSRSRSAILTQEEEAIIGSPQPNEERVAGLQKPRRSFSRLSLSRLSKLSRSKPEPRRRSSAEASSAPVKVRRCVSGKRFNEIVPEEGKWDGGPTTYADVDRAAETEDDIRQGKKDASESTGELRYGNIDFVKHAAPGTSKFQEAHESESTKEENQRESSKSKSAKKQKEGRKASKESKSKSRSPAADKSAEVSRDQKQQSGSGLVRKISRNLREKAKKRDSAVKVSPVPPPILPLPASGSLHVGLENIGRDGYAVVQGPTNPPRRYMLDKILPRTSSDLERLSGIQAHRSNYKGLFVKSPIRSKAPKEAHFEHSKSSSNATMEPLPVIDSRSSLDMLTKAQQPMEDSSMATPSLEATTIARPSLEVPRVVAGHSKSPSMVSTGSNVDDNQSDASSAVLSHALSVSIQRGIAQGPERPRPETPPMSSPPPNIALPPVPEGQTASLIPRPMDTMFEQSHHSPDHSPSRTKPSSERYTVFPKSPTRKPIGETRQPVSPTKPSKDERSDRLVSKPSVRVKITQNFPDPPPSDKVSSEEKLGPEPYPDTGPSMPAELPAETLSRSRPERTRSTKLKDLNRHRRRRADREIPPMPEIKPGGTHHDQIVRFSMTNSPEQHVPLDVICENAKEHQDGSEGDVNPVFNDQEGSSAHLGFSHVLQLDQRPATTSSGTGDEKATKVELMNNRLVRGSAPIAQDHGNEQSPQQKVNGKRSAARLLESPELEPCHPPDSGPAELTRELMKSISSKSIGEETDGFESQDAKIRRLESTIETLVWMLAQGIIARETRSAGDGNSKSNQLDAKPGAQAPFTVNHQDDSSAT